jgi:uncharacterized Zn-binding protein involved in type VI secretion
MSSISVNPPHTPVTEGSGGKAFATTPNVCKMPGPPAPFVPTPLPNLGTSGDRLSNGTTTVKFEGKKVAIKGSYFMSQPSGDVASQGTGGGLISSKTQGKTEWLAPGSLDVKADGKNIQLLGDAMGNNGGSPVNAATMKELQDAIGVTIAKALCDAVCEVVKKGGRGQSAKAEKKFLKGRRKGTWTRQKSFKLKDATGKCRPDLYNPKTKMMVELKLCPNEPYTKNQKQFQDELARGKHRPHNKSKFVKVTPATCGCPGW